MRNNKPEHYRHDTDADETADGEPSSEIGVLKRGFNLHSPELHKIDEATS
jgi:hypothetical protein